MYFQGLTHGVVWCCISSLQGLAVTVAVMSSQAGSHWHKHPFPVSPTSLFISRWSTGQECYLTLWRNYIAPSLKEYRECWAVRKWKGAGMIYFNVLSWSLYGETEKIIENLNIVGNLSEVWRGYLPNTSILKLHIEVWKIRLLLFVIISVVGYIYSLANKCRKIFHPSVYCYRQDKEKRQITLILNYVIHKHNL
jgi:hypothetical protein